MSRPHKQPKLVSRVLLSLKTFVLDVSGANIEGLYGAINVAETKGTSGAMALQTRVGRAFLSQKKEAA
jgi:hypothetical protein